MSNVREHPSAPRISQYRRDGVVVLRLRGGLDRELADEVRDLALGAHAPVVVDLDECVLIDPASVQRIASGWDFYRPEMCIVAHGPTAGRLLRRAGVDQHLAIFELVEDAIRARLGRSKQGDPWSPNSPLR